MVLTHVALHSEVTASYFSSKMTQLQSLVVDSPNRSIDFINHIRINEMNLFSFFFEFGDVRGHRESHVVLLLAATSSGRLEFRNCFIFFFFLVVVVVFFLENVPANFRMLHRHAKANTAPSLPIIIYLINLIHSFLNRKFQYVNMQIRQQTLNSFAYYIIIPVNQLKLTSLTWFIHINRELQVVRWVNFYLIGLNWIKLSVMKF